MHKDHKFCKDCFQIDFADYYELSVAELLKQ